MIGYKKRILDSLPSVKTVKITTQTSVTIQD